MLYQHFLYLSILVLLDKEDSFKKLIYRNSEGFTKNGYVSSHSHLINILVKLTKCQVS